MAKVKLKVRKVVEELHAEGFVHGDVRDTNILIDRRLLGDTDDVKIHLIDFHDWAGPIAITT
jgi:tRNA A-37 threonylcarbamoyl transferase component Bud32